MATTLSLVVIFLPVAFMGGIVGRFFQSFGLTVAFAIAISLFVSFTLTPMLCVALPPARRTRRTRRRQAASTAAIDRFYGALPPLVARRIAGAIVAARARHRR